MDSFDWQPALLQARADLHKTAGISCDDQINRGRLNILHLAVQEPSRHFRLGQIVGAGTPTAPVGLLQFSQLQPCD